MCFVVTNIKQSFKLFNTEIIDIHFPLAPLNRWVKRGFTMSALQSVLSGLTPK
jgi:hypothetical protein